MRVVAGRARGRTLRAPEGRGTRPTSDRVREAIFSMLTSMDAIEGSTVVDLFAGSGALGIEALSRGATAVTFVDSDRAAIDAVRGNLDVLGELGDRVSIWRGDAIAYARTAPAVDLAFADPPYAFEHWPELLASLAPRVGLLVMETSRERDPGPGWETVKVKRYGSTVVIVMQPAREGEL